MLLHGKYRCLGFSPGNFVITGLEWNWGVSFPGDHNTQLGPQECGISFKCNVLSPAASLKFLQMSCHVIHPILILWKRLTLYEVHGNSDGGILTDLGPSFFCQGHCHEQRASYPRPSRETCLTWGFSALAKLTRGAGWSFVVGVVQLSVEHKQHPWPPPAECRQHPQSCDSPECLWTLPCVLWGTKMFLLKSHWCNSKNSLEILYLYCTCLLGLFSCARFFATLPARLLCQWNSPDKNTGVGSHSLLQRIFLTQGSNLGLLHCRQILYPLSHWRSCV